MGQWICLHWSRSFCRRATSAERGSVISVLHIRTSPLRSSRRQRSRTVVGELQRSAPVGVQAGRQTSKVLVRKYISKNVLRTLVRWAAKYLGIKLTQRAIITKVVPLAGAAIGGGWNWFEVRRLGRRALAYHQGQFIEIEPEPTATT